MYRLIACDLDETLLDHNHEITQGNRDAIARARAAGVKFVPASGRGFNSIYGTLKDLGLYEEPGEYVISFNGGAITENRGDKLLHFEGISYERAEALFQRGRQYDVCIHVYTVDKVYVYNVNPEERSYIEGRMPNVWIDNTSLDFIRDDTFVKVLFQNLDQDYLHRIDQELSDLTADMDVSYSSNRYLEFNHQGVNKGAGLVSLAELLGIPIEETIAIGDNVNDLPMIQAAGLGVGVANAAEEIRPHCDVITARDNSHDAIAEVIDRFVFGQG